MTRRCRARHPALAHLQCEGEVTEQTVHLEDHWATDPADRALRHSWQDEPLAPPGVRGARQIQVGGDHYSKHKIQVWDVVDEYDLSYYEGQVLKYLLRRKAGRLEDLEKARHVLDKLIELEGERSGEA